MVATIPLEAHEKRVFRLEFGKKTGGETCLNKKEKMFENEFYRLRWDRFGICSLIEKRSGKEVLGGEHRLGQPVYQIFPKAIRWQAAGFNYSSRKEMNGGVYDGKASKVWVRETGDVFTVLRAEYRVKGAVRYNVDFTLYNRRSTVEIGVECVKTLELDAEGMYIALPFTWQGAEWYLDKPHTLIQPGDQLPETCCDYYGVDRGIVASDGSTTVSVNTFDAPLVTVGGLKLWKYTRSIEPKGEAFTWLTNNKWETNFRTQCAGCLESRYVIDFAAGEAEAALEKLEENDNPAVCLRH